MIAGSLRLALETVNGGRSSLARNVSSDISWTGVSMVGQQGSWLFWRIVIRSQDQAAIMVGTNVAAAHVIGEARGRT